MQSAMMSCTMTSRPFTAHGVGFAPGPRATPRRASFVQPMRAASAAGTPAGEELRDELGFKLMRKGVKEFSGETILTPRFYTTDFDEMEKLYSLKENPNLRMDELEASLAEFRRDYNQCHFVRNATFPEAANKLTGATRKIFIEFLERSCCAEFSGFLLYKELGRRLKDANPVLSEIFTLLARDEARHAGFINKSMSDFNLALDLGFLTRNRKYTFFKPKFIVYATFLSEKIGYWRYISIYRHLQRNPDCQLYPLFEYFENWCQDESRHGDFLAGALKCHPGLLKGTAARLWCRFFCLSVYITMYLNDHQRTFFYESLGMDTTKFDRHVIIETNNTTERIFPEVPDVMDPEFFKRMDDMVVHNSAIQKIMKSDAPNWLKSLQKLPHLERILKDCVLLYLAPTKKTGSLEIEGDGAYQY